MTNIKNFIASFNNKSDSIDPLVYIYTSDSSLKGYIGILNNACEGVEDDLDLHIWNDTVGYNMVYCLDTSRVEQSQVVENKEVTKYIFSNDDIKVEIHFEK